MIALGLGRLAFEISPFACLIPGGDKAPWMPLLQPQALSFPAALLDNSSFLHSKQIQVQMPIPK